jgi:hypothetical protein
MQPTRIRRSILAAGLLAFAAAAGAASVGDRGKAPWSRDHVYYPAEITAISGSRCHLHWLIPWQHGEYDEWGACAAFVPDAGARVYWQGSWYPATVIGYGANCYEIHYTGYADSWNECVGAERIRW